MTSFRFNFKPLIPALPYAALVVFAIVFVCWFRLEPELSAFGSPYWAVYPLMLYALILGARWALKFSSCLRTGLSFALALAAVLLTLDTLIYFPHLKQVVSNQGTTYYLVTVSNSPPSDILDPYYFLTKWYDPIHYSSSILWYSDGPLKLSYDSGLREMDILRISHGQTWLFYTDSNPPRYYEWARKLGNNKYYLYETCTPTTGYWCSLYVYTLYRCDLDNTSCRKLPFEYSGSTNWKTHYELDAATGHVNLFFNLGEYPGQKTLIYTYSEQPQCHVAECSLNP